MPVDSKHPDYIDRVDEWSMMRHADRGEKAVKEQGETYLPMPDGFRVQKDEGKAIYEAYQKRARFPDIVGPTLQGMVGVIHRTEAQIAMPTSLERIWERATPDGLTLEALHKRITGELLLMGRHSLLTDIPSTGGDLPYIAGYNAESLINWSPNRDLFVLNESRAVHEFGDEFNWKTAEYHRVLRLRNGRYSAQVYKDHAVEKEPVEPMRRGGGAMSEIPLVVIGARDLALRPDEPPLIGVARSALAIYRLDADYRHQLFMTGQETLFVINGEAPKAVGAGVVVTLMGDENSRPDAKYVSPSGSGIAAHRQAILDEREAAVSAGARVFDGGKRDAELGEALRLRYAAQTATLTSVALASAAGLEKALRYAAIMMGADPLEVEVKPNLKFVETAMTPADAQALVGVWQSGGISYRTLYENLQRGEIASAERSVEDERELIDQEVPDTTTDPNKDLQNEAA